MPSSLDLTTARSRVRDLLMDSGAAVWANNQIDQGLRRALEEYSRAALDPRTAVQPNALIATFTPAANLREQDISALTGVQQVNQVWFPYTASLPEDPPRVCEFRFYWNGTTPLLYLDGATAPDGVMVARVFYLCQHTLNSLDSASATTFSDADENLVLEGAAGYCCEMRSVDLNEIASNMAVSTPNYAALGELFLSTFRAALTPRNIAISHPLQDAPHRARIYDPSRLGYR